MAIVSVIIPTRNRLDFLKEAVASVSTQDYPHRETIVVDDASEDGTWDWLSSLDDPSIRIFRLSQRGERSAARNLGLCKATGELAMFLDDDDQLVPKALSYLCAGAKRFPAAMAVSGNRLFFDQTGREYTYPHPRRAVVRKIWRDVLAGWIPQASQCIIRKRAVLEAGGWDPRLNFAEDHALWLKMASPDSVAAVLPGVVARYRIHTGQSRSESGVRGDREARARFVERLPANLHSDAWRILRARRLVRAGFTAFQRHHYRKSARLHAAAILRAPRLLLSPLTRGMLLRGFFRSMAAWIFGPNFIARIQRGKAFFGRTALADASPRNLI